MTAKGISNSEELTPYVGKSLTFHILFALVLFSIPFIFKLLDIKRSEPKISLASSAVRVDIVAMPKLTVKELKTLDGGEAKGSKVDDAFESKESAPEKDAFIEKKKKKSFLDLVKNYKDKDVPKEKKSKSKEKSKNSGSKDGSGSIDNKKLNELLYMGNKVSKGTAIVGSHSEADLSELNRYASQLPGHVRPYWKLPSYLMNKELKCRIQVFINRSGKVISLKVYQSSGEEEYDNKAKEAIRSSEPFPPVPAEISALALKGNILLGFPL